MPTGYNLYPIFAAFTTAFSTPPAAETWAPTFQGLSTRAGKSAILGSSADFVLRVERADAATNQSQKMMSRAEIDRCEEPDSVPPRSATLTFFFFGELFESSLISPEWAA